MRILLMFALVWLTGLAHAQGRLAIIIDDMGNSYRIAKQVLELPKAVTVSILPRLTWSRRIALMAYRQGRESMLHQPMTSISGRAMGPGGLGPEDTRADIEAVLTANLASVPHVAGVNNHMGSLLTRQDDSMRHFMQTLRQRNKLYFVDSRTIGLSLAAQKARDQGLASAARDVFLDNDRDPVRIRERLHEAIRLARLKGTALAIGHPYPETVEVLASELRKLDARDVELVPVSRLIALQRSPKTWLASSSHLPKVAKSSKLSPSSTCCDAPISK